MATQFNSFTHALDGIANKQTWLKRNNTRSVRAPTGPSPSSRSPWGSDDDLSSVLDLALALTKGKGKPSASLAARRSSQAPGQRQPPGLFQRSSAADVSPPPGLMLASQLALPPPPSLVAPPALPAREAGAWSLADTTFAGELAVAEREMMASFVPSLGSSLHGSGACRPCNWFWKPGSCQNGSSCSHCHLCPPDTQQQRKKRVAGLKQSARERLSAPGESAAAARASSAQQRHGAHVMAPIGPFDTHMPVHGPLPLSGLSTARASRSSSSVSRVEEEDGEGVCRKISTCSTAFNDDGEEVCSKKSTASMASRVSFNDEVEIIEIEY